MLVLVFELTSSAVGAGVGVAIDFDVGASVGARCLC